MAVIKIMVSETLCEFALPYVPDERIHKNQKLLYF